jgi:hypothetical protein
LVSLTLREEHRLRIFENRVLRRIFGLKRDDVMGECRKLHSEELHNWHVRFQVLTAASWQYNPEDSSELHTNWYSSPDIKRYIRSRRMSWAGHVAHMGEDRKVYKVLVGKPEGMRPLGRPRHRWENGIRIDLREIGWGDVDWVQHAWDRDQWQAVLNLVMNLRVLVPQS